MSHQIPKSPQKLGSHTAINPGTVSDSDSETKKTDVKGTMAGRKISMLPHQDSKPTIKMGQLPKQFSVKVDRFLSSRGVRGFTFIIKKIIGRSESPSSAVAEFRRIDRSTLWQKQKTLPEDPLQAKQLCIDSALCQYPYKHNDQEIAKAHNVDGGKLANSITFAQITDSEDSTELSEFVSKLNENPHFSGRLKHKKGLIYDTKTGFVATLFKDKKTGQVKLVFGGTTSGQKLPFPDDKKLLLRQTLADAANFLGTSIPECYEQAAEIAQVVIDQFDPHGQGLVSVTGHSLGGAMAQFAGVTHKIPANCFSAAALGKAALVKLAHQRLDPDWIKENITQVMVKGDPVSNPLGLKMYSSKFSATNLGTRITLEGQRRLYSDPVFGRHMFSHKHVYKAVKAQLTDPGESTQ